MTAHAPIRVTADGLVDEIDGWRFTWFEREKKRAHVRALDTILGSNETAEVILEQISAWRRTSFESSDRRVHLLQLDAILGKVDALTSYTKLLADARKVAMKGVPKDDGHSYLVPSADLAAYQKTILALIDAVSDLLAAA